MTTEYFVFVDESGDPSITLEKQGTSNYFVLAACIVSHSTCHNLRNECLYIQKTYFNGKPIKSSNIKPSTRSKILERLAPFEFNCYALIVDKSQIDQGTGLAYRPSFYKYFSSMLYQAIVSPFPGIRVTSDTHGKKEYMESFDNYLDSKNLFRLFSDFRFCKNSEEPILGVSDIVAGTINKFVEGQIPSTIYNIIKNKVIIKSWPTMRWQKFPNLDSSDNSKIRNYNIAKIEEFEKSGNHAQSEYYEIQLATLNLLLNWNLGSETEYIYADAILNKLDVIGLGRHDKQFLATNVIGPIRDYGILISGSSKGLKLAFSASDVIQYFKHSTNIILPLNKRLLIARDVFFKITGKDPVAESPIILSILDSFKESISDPRNGLSNYSMDCEEEFNDG